ncbi:hypothetical protein EDB80DRAFT_757029 [Ilyonectria destructans]|nr:hypothetical protein EDB80DRAFT_757029 [Ilyonectria destructans]
MDLVYAEHPPGKYSESQLVTGALATTKKGGRGRSWAEWAELWAIIADWVYEHEAASLEMLYIDKYSYKYDPSDEVHKTLPHGKIPREFLATDAIDAADAIRDVFAQLAAKPTDFQGIEWDFLDLEVTRDVRDAFFARFGRNPDSQKFMEESIDRTKPYSLETLKKMVEPVAGSRWGDLNLYNVSPVALKRCPVGFLGADWEAWLMSIEGGDVVVVKTVFQALWAVMLLVQLPLNIKILSREERLPRYQDPNNIYIGASS